MNKSLMMPPEREGYASGSIAALAKVFGKKTPSEKAIKAKLKAVHASVSAASENVPLKTTYAKVASEFNIKPSDVKRIEKTFAVEAGGGESKGFLDSIVKGIRSTYKEPTLGQRKDKQSQNTQAARSEKVKTAAVGLLAGVGGGYGLSNLEDEDASPFEKAFSAAHNANKETFTFEGEEFTTEVRKGKAKGGSTDDDAATYEEYRKRFIEETIQERKEQEEAEKERRAGNKRRTAETLKEKMTEGEKRAIAEETMRLNDEAAERYYADKERLGKAEGSLMIPQEGMPVDTYDNIPPEEMEEAMASQLPDDEMEDSYTSYVMDESLDDEEQEYLATVLESDPRLSDILDKVITVASEFSGQGEVAGPGTGVSDSIPARLSDGEFVMTKKATDQLGADNLQVMMDDAERAYDGGYQMKAMGGVMDEEDPADPMMSKTKEEIEKLMMGANRMPSLQ
jgi:hypothetical protein